MSVTKDIKFDFDDLLIVPAENSKISSRKEVNVYDSLGMLPLFTAPMDTVVGLSNIDIFKKNKIYPIVPRTVPGKLIEDLDNWFAVGLKDLESYVTHRKSKDKSYILIDIANGHMDKLISLVRTVKAIDDNLVLMVGNVANPETYGHLSEAGADYVRIGVGNGGGCWIQGTKVLTKNGYKNIENINVDDIVLTHTGEWKPVILTHELNYSEDLIEINGEISTKDHQYYVIDKENADLINENNYQKYAYWIEAEKLTIKHLLLEIEKNDL